jgi:ferredoxin
MTSLYLKDDNIKVKVPPGMTLRQIAKKTGASMEFGCRVGDCGTCIAKIEEGMECLNALNQKELDVFAILNQQSEGHRLMCQCTVESREGEIVISYNSL